MAFVGLASIGLRGIPAGEQCRRTKSEKVKRTSQLFERIEERRRGVGKSKGGRQTGSELALILQPLRSSLDERRDDEVPARELAVDGLKGLGSFREQRLHLLGRDLLSGCRQERSKGSAHSHIDQLKSPEGDERKGRERQGLTIPGSDGSMSDGDEDGLLGESDPELALERTDDIFCLVSLAGSEEGADDGGFAGDGLGRAIGRVYEKDQVEE
jgi:hypothetical protein